MYLLRYTRIIRFGLERSVGEIHHTGSPLEMQLSNVFEHNLFTSVCIQMSSTCATIVNKFPLIYNQLTSSP